MKLIIIIINCLIYFHIYNSIGKFVYSMLQLMIVSSVPNYISQSNTRDMIGQFYYPYIVEPSGLLCLVEPERDVTVLNILFISFSQFGLKLAP